MGKIATSLDEQIELLVKRGMVVEDKDYARRKLETPIRFKVTSFLLRL